MRRIFALLDSPFLTRVGNLRTLGSVAVLGVLIVIGAVLAVLSVGPWWPVVGAMVMWLTALLVVFVSWRRSLVPGPVATIEPLTLADTLTTEIAAGEVLLREARQPDKLATSWHIDDFMRRGEEWAERISATLAEHGHHRRLDDWAHVSVWNLGRPNWHNADDVRNCLVEPLWERLQILEQFAREDASGVADDDPRGTAHPDHLETPDGD